ncbi:hypothetical protein ABAC460_16765 [Asticcacaulis sp. AC460]|uniref:Imm50 family immunity protein n=1 Tax=Asticcacaulis sp. AC460 TaxID=1282360 RepID=UPI0003C3FF98|nr:Imm50 family immunity protein [Asticcacaulis sp. AC460]ESQ88312.1 hypothetical protein ABAC460_16765 [Asticcacaulis sp. AC460]
MTETNEIDWTPVVQWFGHVPGFHDSEVVSIDLRRDPLPSVIRLRAFRMNADTDEKGYFRLDLHCLVTFTLSGVQDVELEGWNHQNALMGLEITKTGDVYRLDLDGAWGVQGFMTASHIAIELEPWSHEPALK